MVRAKFKCVENGPRCGHNVDTVCITLEPVTSGSAENESFFKYTPGGKVELSVVNPAAAEQFVVGKEFYVDFSPAD